VRLCFRDDPAHRAGSRSSAPRDARGAADSSRAPPLWAFGSAALGIALLAFAYVHSESQEADEWSAYAAPRSATLS